MSESACGGATDSSGAEGKGVVCPKCGKACKSKHGLKIHDGQKHDGHSKLRDPDWLWEKRWVEGKDQREIAEILDVSHNAVGYQLRKHGISGRIHPYLDDPEILHDLYIRRDMGVYEICKEYDVNKSTIAERCQEFGFNKDIHRTNVWGLRWALPFIKEKYHQDKWSTNEIADELGVTIAPLIGIMDRYGITRRDQSWYEGERNKLWKGGRSNTIYKGRWATQRDKARERDNCRCQRCGVKESDISRELDVHHKKPYRKFEDKENANKLENVITLCRSCHGKMERWPVQPE